MERLIENLRDFYDHLVLKFRKKGEERLTIMVIPHGQEKMFSLQLNWFMIVFLAGTLALAVFLAFYGFYLKRLHEQEINRLQTLYGNNFQRALELTRSVNEIRGMKRELRDSLFGISEVIGIPEYELGVLPAESAMVDRARLMLLRESVEDPEMGIQEYLPPVYALRTTQYLLEGHTPLLEALTESLEDGLGVYNDMPLGRPFRNFNGLHDTSQYGVRVNPVTKLGFEFHTGFDTSGPLGTPIHATGPGEVYRVYGPGNGYGRAVVIKHDFGYYSMFAHMTQTEVRVGDRVYRGQRIGTMGRTGRATGTHLHYEIWLGTSQRINPEPFLCSIDFDMGRCRSYHRESVASSDY